MRDDTGNSSGFSLVEAIVAIAITGVLLSAFALVAVSGIRGSSEARINQQAGDIIDSGLEAARTQTYSNLTMTASDATLGTDSRVVASGCPSSGAYCVSLPNASGSGSSLQSLVTSTATGYITQHVQTVNSNTNKVVFTVATYISSPTDEASASYKRVTVYVSWTLEGQSHQRVGSTLIADTRRGLPLPHFTVTPILGSNFTVNPGTLITEGFTINNLGARDSFSFGPDSAVSGSTVSYYLDDGDGTYDAADTALTPAGGLVTTPSIEPTASATIWVLISVPSTATASTTTITYTATSISQPGFGSGVSSQNQQVTINVTNSVITPTPTTSTTPTTTTSPTQSTTPAACTAVGTTATTGTEYYLHNTSDGTNYSGNQVNAFDPMAFSSNVPSASSLADFSQTDGYGNIGGRNLTASSANFSETDSTKVATWQIQINKGGTTYSGTTYLDVWAAPSSGSASDTVSLKAMVGWGSGKKSLSWTNETGTATTTATGTASGTGCGQWREFIIAIPTNTFKPSNNDWIDVQLFNTGSKDVRLAYDTTTYMSNVVWKQG